MPPVPDFEFWKGVNKYIIWRRDSLAISESLILIRSFQKLLADIQWELLADIQWEFIENQRLGYLQFNIEEEGS